MSEAAYQITNALLRVAADLGHGGPISEYRIDLDTDSYTVTVRISKLLPSPGEGRLMPPQPPSRQPLSVSRETAFKPSEITESLPKNHQQTEEFLTKLSADFNIYEFADLKSPYPFLHPTFYSFSFRDSSGRTHGFEYQIECSNHLDERYRELIQEFDNFFESKRVFDKFYEIQRRK